MDRNVASQAAGSSPSSGRGTEASGVPSARHLGRVVGGILAPVLLLGGVLLGVVPASGASAAPAAATAGTEPYYVSLGDSYSVGYQPGHGSTSGYTGVVAGDLGMQLENFGCGGATSSSILDQIGCPANASARTDPASYPTTTQAAAAESFLQAHRGQVGLVTVSIGGNTITSCATSSTPVTCVVAALGTLKTNLATLLDGLRSAAGTSVPIIGLTYPDVILGTWVYPPGATDQSLAQLSVTAFEDYINPALQAAYAAVGGGFVDVTTATGVSTPLTETVTLPPYGTIPTAVAEVCQLTYFCTSGTIHANTAGYTLIGNLVVSAFRAQETANGYWEVAGDGGIFAFGSAQFYGSMGGKPLNKPVVGMAATPTGGGYWEVASDGGIFAFGNAQFYGSMGGAPLDAPVVGMAAAPTGRGYWEVASDGGIFAFGSAQFYGSMGGKQLDAPVMGMAAAPTGQGYWEVAADGDVFSFGKAGSYGSEAGVALKAPVMGMATTPTGQGYWEVAADGGIFSFGSAQFYGSMGGKPLNRPVMGMATTTTGNGYWEVAADGGIFAFGSAQFYGSMGGKPLNRPVVGMAAVR